MATAMILEPLTGDTVTEPVIVKASYNTNANFTMGCRVNITDEAPPQPHTAASSPGVHVSTGIAPGAGTWVVFARDVTNLMAPVNLDQQPGVQVLANGNVGPVIITTGVGGLLAVGKGFRKKKPIKGEAAEGAAYVICRIYEVDSMAQTRVLIAAGAATVKKSGTKYKWSVEVKFVTKAPDNFQYVARVTAFDKDSTSLGTTTKQIKK